MNKYVNKKTYYPVGGCGAGRIAYFLVIYIFPVTPIRNFRFLNIVLKYHQFSKKKCILAEGILKRKHIGEKKMFTNPHSSNELLNTNAARSVGFKTILSDRGTCGTAS